MLNRCFESSTNSHVKIFVTVLWKAERKRIWKRSKLRFIIYLFAIQIPAKIRMNEELGTHSRSPIWVKATRVLELSQISFRTHVSSKLKLGVGPGFEPRFSDMQFRQYKLYRNYCTKHNIFIKNEQWVSTWWLNC